MPGGRRFVVRRRTRADAGSQSPASQNPNPQGAAVFRGRVVAADTGAPLRHAHVQPAPGNQAVPPALTDRDGRFAISSLSRTVTPFCHQARVSADHDRQFANGCRDRHSDGEGRRHRRTHHESRRRSRDRHGGHGGVAADPQHKPIATSQTDDLGDYRVGGLAEGSYLVRVTTISPLVGPQGELVTAGDLRLTVNGQNVTSDDLRRRAGAFYPGVETLADALAVTVAPGEERTAIDFPAPVFRRSMYSASFALEPLLGGGVPSGFTGGIRGRVVAADGRPLPQALVTLQSDDFPSLIPPAIADEDGQYEFQKLSAGTFSVIAMKAGFVTME